MRFGLLMIFFMATSFVLLLSRIFALAAVIQAVYNKSKEPARKSQLGKASCWMLGTSIVGGSFFYYVYGNGIIFSNPARVCTGRSDGGVQPYPDSKLLVKTGTFLQWYSLAVQGGFALLVAAWGLYFCCILVSCKGGDNDEEEEEPGRGSSRLS